MLKIRYRKDGTDDSFIRPLCVAGKLQDPCSDPYQMIIAGDSLQQGKVGLGIGKLYSTIALLCYAGNAGKTLLLCS